MSSPYLSVKAYLSLSNGTQVPNTQSPYPSAQLTLLSRGSSGNSCSSFLAVAWVHQGTFPTWGLCTCCSFYQDCSSHTDQYGSALSLPSGLCSNIIFQEELSSTFKIATSPPSIFPNHFPACFVSITHSTSHGSSIPFIYRFVYPTRLWTPPGWRLAFCLVDRFMPGPRTVL